MDKEVFISGYARTPSGRFGGACRNGGAVALSTRSAAREPGFVWAGSRKC